MRVFRSRAALATASVLVAGAISWSVWAGVPAGPVLIAEVRDGTVYLGGRRIALPYRIAVDGERVLVNGLDTAPRESPASTSAAAIPPEIERALPEISLATARVDALVDSLLGVGAPASDIAERARDVFLESPLVEAADVTPAGDIAVTWRGVPGRQAVWIGCRRITGGSGAAGGATGPARAAAWAAWLAASLARGEFYAAGAGYQISLGGDIAGWMELAIREYLEKGDETLRVGGRSYDAFAAELRSALREDGVR